MLRLVPFEICKKMYKHSEFIRRRRAKIGDYYYFIDGDDVRLVHYTRNTPKSKIPKTRSKKWIWAPKRLDHLLDIADMGCAPNTSVSISQVYPEGFIAMGNAFRHDVKFQACAWSIVGITDERGRPDYAVIIGEGRTRLEALAKLIIKQGKAKKKGVIEAEKIMSAAQEASKDSTYE